MSDGHVAYVCVGDTWDLFLTKNNLTNNLLYQI